MLLNFSRPQFMNLRNQLECLSLAGLSDLVLCSWVRPRAYPRVMHLKGASPGQALALLSIIRLGWTGLSGTSTLANLAHLCVTIVKKFYDIGNRRGWPLGNSQLSECHVICPSVDLSICSPAYLPTFRSVHLSICYRYIFQSTHLSPGLSICSAVYQSVHLFVNLFTCLSIC